MSFFLTFYLGKKREASEQLKELVSDLSSHFISTPALRTRRKNVSNTPILVDELVRKCTILFVCLFKCVFKAVFLFKLKVADICINSPKLPCLLMAYYWQLQFT